MKNNEDKQFTNKQNIEYPSLNETADIRVINNNIKILEEEKANISNLQDVARESSPKNIENKVNSIDAKTTNINNGLSNVARETTPKNIENKVKSIDTKATNINNLMNTVNNNVINVNNGLSNVAKESSPKNIENKVIQLENKLNELEDKIGVITRDLTDLAENETIDFNSLKNIIYKEDYISSYQDNNYRTLLNIKGKGKFFEAIFEATLSGLSPSDKNLTQGLKITLDDEIIYWHEIDVDSNLVNYPFVLTLGKSKIGVTCSPFTPVDDLMMGYKNVSLDFSHYISLTTSNISSFSRVTEALENGQLKLLETSKLSNQKITWNNNNIPKVLRKTASDGETYDIPAIVPTAPVYIGNKFLKFEKSCKIEAKVYTNEKNSKYLSYCVALDD